MRSVSESPRCYDRDGQPMELFEWAHSFKNAEKKIVAKHLVGRRGAVEVSTVWLGLDHNFTGLGPPLIFETMVFGGRLDQYQWRWSTEQEAREGHWIVLRRVRYRFLLPARDVTEEWLRDIAASIEDAG